MDSPIIAIVGAGPRGISTIERLAAAVTQHAREGAAGPFEIHLIDDAQHGAGRIWETEQTRQLCMNTLAGAVTLFTEPGASVGAPVVEGPTLIEWIRYAHDGTQPDSVAKAELVAEVPIDPKVREAYEEELAASVDESHPSRALYGEYLRWCLEVALRQLPESVTVVPHRARLVDVAEGEAGTDLLTLADAEGNRSTLAADATVLALGWQVPGPTEEETTLAQATAQHPELVWIRPDNPIEQDLTRVPAGEPALVRGLGMGFFDALTLLTLGRGGRFIEDPQARSGLSYHPSGEEPHVLVSSRRGYPFLPKSAYGSLPPEADLPRLNRVIEQLTGEQSIDFGTEVWPAIVRDSFEAYYRTLDEVEPQALGGGLTELLDALDHAPAAGATTVTTLENAAADFVDPDHAFSLSSWITPLAGVTGTPEEVTERVARGLERDIAEAVAAWKSPLKSGLWAISFARKPASVLGAEGVYTAESRAAELSTFMSLGQMVGSGPPLFRTRELLALIDAGLVTVLGADPRLEVDADGFAITTASTGQQVHARTLIDAWMHAPTIARPQDPLARALTRDGRWREFANHTADGTPVPTGSPEVDPETRALVHPDGKQDPRLLLIGIPTRGQMPDTTISPMPGTDPLMLQETDKAARHALAVALGEA